MFGIHIITDVIKIPASDLQYQNTVTTVAESTNTTLNAKNRLVNGNTTTVRNKVVKKKSLLPMIHREIDILYPNRILIDIGLVICRYYHPHSTTVRRSSISQDLLPTIETNQTPCDDPTNKKRKRSPSVSVTTKQNTKEEFFITGTKLLQNGGTCDNYGSSMNGGCGVHYKVQFPVIVFRPYVGEVLYGTIYDMNQNGIVVALGNFFAAIYIPTIYMLQPSTYTNSTTEGGASTSNANSNNGIWVWAPTYDDDDENDDTNEPLRYEMNIGDEIRVRVKSIHYSKAESTTMSCQNGKPSSMVDPVPKRPTFNVVTNNNTAVVPNAQQQPQTLQHCAMYIIASICEDGLGLTSWWKNEVDGDDEEEEENDEIVSK